jgi:hypothetical protein
MLTPPFRVVSQFAFVYVPFAVAPTRVVALTVFDAYDRLEEPAPFATALVEEPE